MEEVKESIYRQACTTIESYQTFEWGRPTRILPYTAVLKALGLVSKDFDGLTPLDFDRTKTDCYLPSNFDYNPEHIDVLMQTSTLRSSPGSYIPSFAGQEKLLSTDTEGGDSGSYETATYENTRKLYVPGKTFVTVWGDPSFYGQNIGSGANRVFADPGSNFTRDIATWLEHTSHFAHMGTTKDLTIQPFCNIGRDAGASLPIQHTQQYYFRELLNNDNNSSHIINTDPDVNATIRNDETDPFLLEQSEQPFQIAYLLSEEPIKCIDFFTRIKNGKLSIDDIIKKLEPGLQDLIKLITIFHHKAGLGNNLNIFDIYDPISEKHYPGLVFTVRSIKIDSGIELAVGKDYKAHPTSPQLNAEVLRRICY